MEAKNLAILQVLSAQEGPAGVTAAFIAEACGHKGDTWWASKRVCSLVQRGFVLKAGRLNYVISDLGAQALRLADWRI